MGKHVPDNGQVRDRIHTLEHAGPQRLRVERENELRVKTRVGPGQKANNVGVVQATEDVHLLADERAVPKRIST